MRDNILLKQFNRSVTASVKEVANHYCIFLYGYMTESLVIVEKLSQDRVGSVLKELTA